VPVAACAAAGFLIACTFGPGGFRDPAWYADVGHYQILGQQTIDGLTPYHDFYVEYPPGAIPAFVAPAAVGHESGYRLRFRLLMSLCGLVTLVLMAVVLRLLEAGPLRTALALGAAAVAPAALGSPYLNRYDPWATIPIVAALIALVRARAAASGAFLGAAFATKLFAPAAAPLAAIRLARSRGVGALVRGFAWAVAVTVAAFGYFSALAPGGVGDSLLTQMQRGLEAETLGASILLAADRTGIHPAHVVGGLSVDLGGTDADVVAWLSSALGIGVVLWIAFRYLRGPEDPERLVTAFAATVLGFTIFSKVLSPQYLTWLVPLVPLVRGRRGLAVSAVFLACLVMTQMNAYGFSHLTIATWTVWLLLVRNVLLVGVLVVLGRALLVELD
jgi:uncharacterized membrane protein